MRPVLVKGPAARPIEPPDVIARAETLADVAPATIGALIDAATGRLNGWSGILGRCLVEQTWSVEQGVDDRGRYRLPFPDVIRIVSAKTEDGTDHVAAVKLRHDVGASYVAPLNGASFGALTIVFDAGYGAPDAVPEPIKQAIVFMVAAMHAQTSEGGQIRSETVDGVGSTAFNSPEQTTQANSRMVATLLHPFRAGPFL